MAIRKGKVAGIGIFAGVFALVVVAVTVTNTIDKEKKINETTEISSITSVTTIKPETTTAKPIEPSAVATETAATTTTEASNITTSQVETSTFEAEIKPTIYTDEKDKNEYIILSVTPIKIYWNEINEFSLNEGVPIDVFIPAAFSDVVDNADELMLWFTETSVPENELHIDNIDDFNIIRGLKTFNNNIWNVDRMYPVKNDFVVFYDDVALSDIEMQSYRNFDGFMNYPYRHKGEDLMFNDGMPTQEADEFFLAIYNDHQEYLEEVQRLWEVDGIQTEVEYSEWITLLGGTRFRAKINQIY